MKPTSKSILPFAPTDALPGSEEKVRVLTRRARLGQPLWHPLDATLPGAGDTGRMEEARSDLCLAS